MLTLIFWTASLRRVNASKVILNIITEIHTKDKYIMACIMAEGFSKASSLLFKDSFVKGSFCMELSN